MTMQMVHAEGIGVSYGFMSQLRFSLLIDSDFVSTSPDLYLPLLLFSLHVKCECLPARSCLSKSVVARFTP